MAQAKTKGVAPDDRLDQRGKRRIRTDPGGPSMTVQSDAHLADINQIMIAFGDDANDILDEAAMQFGDVSEIGDYHDVMLRVKEAEAEFLKLPSKVREIFDHDVSKWLDTANDADKREKLVAAGFIKAVEDSEPAVEETPTEEPPEAA